jgi:hypothetical protein
MKPKTINERVDTFRKKKRAEGLIKVEYWIRPEHKDKLNRYVKRLNAP